GAENTGTHRFTFFINQHSRVVVKANGGARFTMDFFSGLYNNGTRHFTFFHFATRDGFFNAHNNYVTYVSVTTLRTAQYLNAHNGLSTRVVSDVESAVHLNHRPILRLA